MQPTVFTIANFVFLSAIAANATPVLQLTPRSDVNITGYNYGGCYTEATNMRALTGDAYFDDLMTVEKCAAACSTFSRFGVEYGRECYCGNSIMPGSVSAPETDCSFPCPGDAGEFCGAGNRLNMYTKAASLGSTTTQTLSTYSTLGCYTEPSDSRALTSLTVVDDTMTVEQCGTVCGSHGYSMFGVEYYDECYCGNSLKPGSVPAPSTDCKYACKGNSSELCGGDWRLNLYQWSNTTLSSILASSVSNNFTEVGCYTEAVGIRALSMSTFDDDDMTVEQCAGVCKGYTWFGVEYGRECYCGNSINAGSVPAAPTDCNFPCAGDSTELCGGSNRLNMYNYGTVTSSTQLSSTSSTLSSSSLLSSITSTSSLGVSSTSTSVLFTPTSSSLASSSQLSSSSSSSSSSSQLSSSSSLLSSSSSSMPSSSVIVSSSASSTIVSSSSLSSTLYSTSVSSSFITSVTSSSVSSSAATSSSAAASSSSVVSSSSTTSTTSAAWSCKTPLLDPSFEETNSAKVPWQIYNPQPNFVTYNFQAPSTASNPSVDGSQQASITYTYGPNIQSWFYQDVNLCPSTTYTLSAWTKYTNTIAYVFDAVYYISTTDQTQILDIMSEVVVREGVGWVHSTGTYTSDAVNTNIAFNVRMINPGSVSYARTFYFDAISFTAQ
ncbi:WSC-domain-containing protein [Mollisia scopiformis]|uniref:WSC-domain-containing protein n=1 Tax=Mollisia scopiformis TaxID=149040 RepID=A0A132BD54_MOLSC|nr:WSC-domain-containing protein [Mollisia scopiformis]KUJ09774.1 WSC-domain-containing protein [Mollisia scopiformis]